MLTQLGRTCVRCSARRLDCQGSHNNDNNQKIGTVDDLIIAPDRSVSFAVIEVGGFLGVGKHDVAIPMKNLKEEQNKLILPGATKEALKALPEFQYAKADNRKKGIAWSRSRAILDLMVRG